MNRLPMTVINDGGWHKSFALILWYVMYKHEDSELLKHSFQKPAPGARTSCYGCQMFSWDPHTCPKTRPKICPYFKTRKSYNLP